MVAKNTDIKIILTAKLGENKSKAAYTKAKLMETATPPSSSTGISSKRKARREKRTKESKEEGEKSKLRKDVTTSTIPIPVTAERYKENFQFLFFSTSLEGGSPPLLPNCFQGRQV